MSQPFWKIEGKVCLITGANAGIGFETARGLLKRGAARLILACRNVKTSNEAVELLKSDATASQEIVLYQLDLSSLVSVRECCSQILQIETKLDVLILNAGIVAPGGRTTSADGYELTFATNHLGHFLLTKLLLDLLKKSTSRIVCLTSNAYALAWPGLNMDDLMFEKRYYSAWRPYFQSKLANILFVRELNRRLRAESSAVSVFAVHPGAVRTALLPNARWYMALLMKTLGFLWLNVEDGARTSIYCATEPGIETDSGEYFANCKKESTWSFADDMEVAKQLWEISDKLVENESEDCKISL